MITRHTFLRILGPVLALLAIFALFAAIAPQGFASARNIEMMARQTTIVAAVALGMTVVIVAGGIDLSVGALVALASVGVAVLLRREFSPFVALTGGIALAMAAGFFNGAISAYGRIVPFIVTLGTMLAARGLAKGLADEQKVNAPRTWLNGLLAALGPDEKWKLLPPGAWLVGLLAIVTAFLLRRTIFGRHVFAIGSNPLAAQLCGVPVARVRTLVYVFSGFCAGVAGLLQFSRLTMGDPTVAQGLELNAIAAVVIGGGSLSGGEGSVIGTIVGAAIMTVIASGCLQIGLPNWIQEIVTGAIIIAAVFLDRVRRGNQLT